MHLFHDTVDYDPTPSYPVTYSEPVINPEPEEASAPLFPPSDSGADPLENYIMSCACQNTR